MIEQETHRKRHVLLLAYQSLGIVYGDLSISPLYVYESAFSERLSHHKTEEVIFGACSFIFWSLTIFALLKYVFILLSVDDNGEGGTLAMYTLLCRHAKFSPLPNHQAADEELSAYHRPGYLMRNVPVSTFKRYLEKHKKSRTFLLLVVLFAACMVIGDGVFTPSLAVLSSFEGMQTHGIRVDHGALVIIVCAVLVGLFALQHRGTNKVSFMFAPIVIIWLLTIAIIGVYNIIKWNPKVYLALSPHYTYKFFIETDKDGWLSIGGLLLCITGTEAMYVDLGHFTATSIRIAFSCLVYPCLVLQYLGQAAFLSKNMSAIPIGFYASVPDPAFLPVLVIAILAAVVASQAVISATFSIVKQCHALGCFPRVKVVHTSRWIPWPDLHSRDKLDSYDSQFSRDRWFPRHNPFRKRLWARMHGCDHGQYLVVVASVHLCMAKGKSKYLMDAQNKVSMKWILALGPSLGIVRVPGIGLIYTELVSGVPAIFTHFVTNLPAIHQVVVFVCIKTVSVPHVSDRERYLVGRIGPKAYRMYRCIIRYGYKDSHENEEDYEDSLVKGIADFIQLEAEGCGLVDGTVDSRMAVVRTSGKFGTSLLSSEAEKQENKPSLQRSSRSSKSSVFESLQSQDEDEDEELPRSSQRTRTRFTLAGNENLGEEVKEELMELVEATEAGFAYIVGHSSIKARRSSSFLKRFIINVGYSFLRRNCRSPAVVLHIPHISLIEVGMIYHV
ncbi:hypothetical protein Ancab_032749 [Ancistrocladus abbreviatus]